MRRSPLVRSVLWVNGLVMAGYGIVTVLLVVFVREVLGGGALEFGWVATAQGAGVLGGAGLVGWLCAPGRVPPGRLVALSLLVMGAAYALAFNAPALPVVLASVAVAGLWMTGWSVGQRTLLQRAVPNRYLGRVVGASTTASGLLILVGMGLGSALPDAVGVVPVLTGAAVLYGAAGLLAAATLPGWDAAPGAAAVPGDEPPRSVEERSDQPAATGPAG
jgi:MFS family permease